MSKPIIKKNKPLKTSSLIRLGVAPLIAFLATDIYALCGWTRSTGNGEPEIITMTKGYVSIKIPVSYVPRDAPLGSVIGTSRVRDFWNWQGDATMGCTSQANSTFAAVLDGKIVPGITLPSGSPQSSGTVIKTNIPGVGIVIETETFGDSWVKTGSYPYVPYTLRTVPNKNPRWSSFSVYISLIKIGDIPMGSSAFTNTPIVKFESGKGFLWGYYLNGTVVQAQCSVPQNAKSINVQMGTMERNRFNGKNSFLEAHDFEIPITDCIEGSYPTNQDWNFYTTPNINVKLDGLSGSRFIDTQQGILGLTESSTATGVAVQILKTDGVTPVPLGQDIPIMPMKKSSMALSFKARYIQTSESTGGPSPGSADAKAAFTITYK